ncbi:MAG: helix-turn-helix domain-containing protein [Bacteroidales bacterium]|nr:helix-turn-helix domain-containing protein [Bacteroidales bacterium]
METKEKVLEILKSASKPLRAGEIAEQTGIDKTAVEKAIKSLKDTGLIHSPVRCCYAPL